MPITRREFESGELKPNLLIVGFLKANPDYAYTAQELRTELGTKDLTLTLRETRNILRSLVEKETIEAKTIKRVVYYIYHKPRLGFRVEGR